MLAKKIRFDRELRRNIISYNERVGWWWFRQASNPIHGFVFWLPGIIAPESWRTFTINPGTSATGWEAISSTCCVRFDPCRRIRHKIGLEPMPAQMQFKIFGLQHLAVLLILVSLSLFVAWGARPHFGAIHRWIGRALAFLLLVYAAALYLQQILSGDLNASHSLPMQLCDWVLLACLATLLRPNVLTAEISYFWGLSGALQALLTPDAMQAFPSWRFVQFFWGHGIILLCIVYFIAGRKYRPRPNSILRMMLALQIYAIAAASIDLAFGWNYGYLLHKPAGASLFDYLGPWPWYLLSLEAIGLVNFWLLALPWKLLNRLHPQAQAPTPP